MQHTLRYEQLSCQLHVQGLPDVSAGQGGDAVGIITGWSLRWLGRPELEGKREHLEALLQAVLPYARLLISGVEKRCGGGDLPVDIAPQGQGLHRLSLRSSQPDTPPLEVTLDDAQLADLVRVFDQLRLDPRLRIPFQIPASTPLAARDLRLRVPRRQRLAAPVGGVAVLLLAAGAFSLLPPPRPVPSQRSTAANLQPGQPAASPPPPARPRP